MIIINEEKIKDTNKWKDDSVFVLADFDNTITSYDSYNSWEIIVNNKNISEDYKKEVYDLFKYYRPIEIDETLDIEIRQKHMIDWWNHEIELFIKYNFDENVIFEANNNVELMKFREGFKNFFVDMNKRNIPIIIISAGIGNFIEKFLCDNNCYFENVFVLSNFLKFDNKRLVGFNNNIIHSLNKDIVNLPDNILERIKNRSNIILFGDSISDIKMASLYDKSNILSIGFLEENLENNLKHFKDTFDIVATEKSSLAEIVKKSKILKR